MHRCLGVDKLFLSRELLHLFWHLFEQQNDKSVDLDLSDKFLKLFVALSMLVFERFYVDFALNFFEIFYL